MNDTLSYRGNKIKIQRQEGKPLKLTINNKNIDFEEAQDISGGYQSSLSYLPANTIEDLAQMIIDQQLALSKPKLSGLKNKNK